MNPVVSNVLTLAGILAASYLTYLASTRNKRSDVGQQMIDQHQEQIVEMRSEIRVLQRQVRIQGDYIGALRRHIYDAQPAPPPPWPSDLIA